mgnify:CR=1 FL=1
MSSVKNYTEQGGARTVIGGVLEIVEGGQVIGLPAAFTPATLQENSTATTVAGVVSDLNALLTKLKAAGLMASE